MEKSRLTEINKAIALAGLQIKAVKLRPTDPFIWASGTRNPIYDDNRMFLWYPEYRNLVVEGFSIMVNQHVKNPSECVIAGTMSAGIPWAAMVAQRLNLKMIYVRDKPKDHGLKNQIEGRDADEDLEGFNVVLIEDLISTGGSSVALVDAVRKANGNCNLCLSIFNYGLPNPIKMFAGKIPYKTDEKNVAHSLSFPCELKSILYYPELISVGIENGFISKNQNEMLLDWMADQPHWGEKNGFV